MMKLQKNSYIKDGEFYFATVGENYVAIDISGYSHDVCHFSA